MYIETVPAKPGQFFYAWSYNCNIATRQAFAAAVIGRRK